MIESFFLNTNTPNIISSKITKSKTHSIFNVQKMAFKIQKRIEFLYFNKANREYFHFIFKIVHKAKLKVHFRFVILD